MKRFWLFALMLAGSLAVLTAPAMAKGDEGDDSSDSSMEDVNSAIGALSARVADTEKQLGLKFFGDVRLRYAYQTQDQSDYPGALKVGTNNGVGRIADKGIGRYRARLGVKKTSGDFTGALRISTGQTNSNNGSVATAGGLVSNPNSENQTFDNGFGDPAIVIDQAYLNYEPDFLQKHLKVTVGKMPNPLTTTPIMWDPDINPEGALVELSKDDFKFRAAYFDLVATGGTTSKANGNVINDQLGSDEFMADFQAAEMFGIDKDTNIQLTAGYEYIPNTTILAGGGPGGENIGPMSPLATQNKPVGTNVWDFGKVIPDFQVVEGILTVNHKLVDVPLKWTLHVTDNLDSFNLPNNLSTTGPVTSVVNTKAKLGYSTLSNQYAWFLGLNINSIKAKGDFAGMVALGYVEPNAQMSNLVNDDANFTNSEYLTEQFSYGLEDNVTFLLTSWQLNHIYYAYLGAPNLTLGGTSRATEVVAFADVLFNL